MGAASAFQRQTAVEPDPDQPGRYHAVLDAEWNAPVVPQGGVMAAVGRGGEPYQCQRYETKR